MMLFSKPRKRIRTPYWHRTDGFAQAPRGSIQLFVCAGRWFIHFELGDRAFGVFL